MTRAHDQAVLAQIRADPALTDKVYDSIVTGRPEKYVVLHSNRGVVTPDRATGPARRRRKTYWIHSVGSNKTQADAVAEHVLAQLLNWTATVPGWQCERVTHEASQPVQQDDTVKPPLFYGVDQFDFFTTQITT